MTKDFFVSGSPVAISTAGFVAVAADLLLYRYGPRDPYLSYALRGSGALSILLYLLATRKATHFDFGCSFAGWKGDLVWILKLGLIVLGGYVLLVGGFIFLKRIEWVTIDIKGARVFKSADEMKGYVLTALLMAPVVEELVYRGFAVNALALGYGRRKALWLSGPVFYLLHLAYGYEIWMVHYFIAGWILAWAYLRCGRLWVPVVLHALGNVLMGWDRALWFWAPDAAGRIFG